MRKAVLVSLVVALIGAVLTTSSVYAAAPAASPKAELTPPPPNPYLAKSAYPISHHNSAQNDSTLVKGPGGPSGQLDADRLQYQFLGPAHFGEAISSKYLTGERVIWSNGGDRIAKLDAETFEVLAEYPLPGKHQWTEEEADATIDEFEGRSPDEAPGEAVALAARLLQGLAGVYAMIDRDGNFYVSGARTLVVYGDADDSGPEAPITVRATWDLPADIPGNLGGLNMTYDGRIVLVTDEGYVVAVTRDFKEYSSVRMEHAEHAHALNEERARTVSGGGYGWIRNSHAVDEDGGIYILSDKHAHKVVWTGDRLSVDEADGAWSEPYLNENGLGSGSTPVLMGFGKGHDHLLAFTDAATVMNFTVFWRDAIPKGWRQLPGAPSRRVAGFLPADIGDHNIDAIQTEQAPIVGGYGGLVVNNQPPTTPEGYPAGRAVTLLPAFLGADPRFTPHGMQKFEWDPKRNELREAWVNKKVASPNSVPFVSLGANTAYTIGARNGKWTLEGVHWRTGRARFHYVLGGFKYDSLFSGVVIDDVGNIIYAGPFGKIRILRD